MALLSLVEKIFVVIGCEVGLGAGLATQRLTGTDQLQVVQAAGDATVAVGVESVQGDAGATIYTGVDLRTGEHGIEIRVHDAGCRRRVCVDEVGVGVGRIVRALCVAVTERCLDGCQRRHALGVALELGLAFSVGSFDGGLDLGDGLGVGLRDNQADTVLRSAAVDGLRLPDVGIAPTGVLAGDDFR